MIRLDRRRNQFNPRSTEHSASPGAVCRVLLNPWVRVYAAIMKEACESDPTPHDFVAFEASPDLEPHVSLYEMHTMICSSPRYFVDPRLITEATSAMRWPSSRAAANSFSSIPGESGPVVALAPNAPPPPITIIWLTSIASKIANIVSSFPFETAAPVAKAPPILLRILESRNTPNLRSQLSKKVFTSPDIFPK